MNSDLNMLLAVSSGLSIIIGAVALLIGSAIGVFVNNQIMSNKLGRAKNTAAKILEDALAEVKTLKKESVLDAKEEAHTIKFEADKEIRDRRSEVQRAEDRSSQKEETIARKEEQLDKKQQSLEDSKNNLEKKLNDTKELQEKLNTQVEGINAELEKVAKMTRDEAKRELIIAFESDAKREAAKIVKEITEEAKNDAEKKAKNIITLAVQKCAADHSSEITVSSVSLPNDEIKGRIIGREGRNIRALESATGIDLIIDDTPEAVVLSGFDPVRREIARIALEKLIIDGRIHPARIEETVNKVKKEVDVTMKEAAETAAFDADIHGLHPEIIKTIGRLKFRTSYGQNILNHSLEVAHLAGLMATEIGANAKVAKRGGFLHDLGKAVDHEVEGTHVSIGVNMARKYGESEAVIHCIEAHHGDVEFNSLEAILVQAADAISSSRPGARRESLQNYIKRLKELENIANAFDGVESAYAIQAGREIRIMVEPDKIDDDQALFLAKEIAGKIENELDYPGHIKVNVIRESRRIEYAK
jgi:ribonuclease Y